MIGIKNFDMPYNCYDCDLHNYHECNLTSESIEDDYCWNGDSREKHCPLREVEAITKADYEARLKADMVAMFEELNLEIDEMFARRIDYTVDKIQDLIQQKINDLKAESEDNNVSVQEKYNK